jgi:cytoskeletal protein RodZ
MDRIRRLFGQAVYEPLENDEVHNVNTYEDGDASVMVDGEEQQLPQKKIAPFSWMAYSVFLLLGVAMLWAWYVGSQLQLTSIYPTSTISG